MRQHANKTEIQQRIHFTVDTCLWLKTCTLKVLTQRINKYLYILENAYIIKIQIKITHASL
jgi:hypothetical protein